MIGMASYSKRGRKPVEACPTLITERSDLILRAAVKLPRDVDTRIRNLAVEQSCRLELVGQTAAIEDLTWSCMWPSCNASSKIFGNGSYGIQYARAHWQKKHGGKVWSCSVCHTSAFRASTPEHTAACLHNIMLLRTVRKSAVLCLLAIS